MSVVYGLPSFNLIGGISNKSLLTQQRILLEEGVKKSWKLNLNAKFQSLVKARVQETPMHPATICLTSMSLWKGPTCANWVVLAVHLKTLSLTTSSKTLLIVMIPVPHPPPWEGCSTVLH